MVLVRCLNPACPSPANSGNPRFCLSCGVELNVPYVFRDRYRVVRVLGQGAFGRTYQAEDIECLNRSCVIKKFIAQGQGKALQKAKELFEREAKRLYELDHPQIPRLYAYFEQKNSMYLVQQFIEGENLLEECLQQGPFDEQKIRELLQSLLPVLQYIHDNGLLHRDIKPENIMRRASTPSRRVGGNLVLIDFGGAKQITGTVQAAPGTVIYTPGYAAFEHINGQPRKASDLYSLGATCVRLLTGCFPYRVPSGNLQDEIYDADNGRWLWREYLQQQGKTVSHELGEILELLLKQFPQSRYQSAEEVLAALNARSPRSTVPPTVIHPPRGNVPKSPKRNRPAAAKPSSNNPPRLSRAAFLKWASFAGGGAIVAGVLGSLFPNILSKREPKIDPNDLPERPDSAQTFNFDVITVNASGQEINRRQEEANFFAEALGNGVSLEMVAIPSGTFWMGSPWMEEERVRDEGPQHEVSIKPFFMGKYEVTQAQYQAIMGNNPSYFEGDKRPVESVSWNDAVEFCQKLSQKTGREYRLPSEAEWEYACRAGTTTPFHFGETITTELANYRGTDFEYEGTIYSGSYGNGPKGQFREQTTDVGSFPPNAFGLYDMHGNVWEWCLDDWHENYNGAPTDGSAWLNTNNFQLPKVLRGGSWAYGPQDCRSADRSRVNPVSSVGNLGFRVACVGSSRTLT